VSDLDLTIDDLAAAAALPSRTIRFYQTKGLLPRPEMQGRVAHYGPAHVERLRQIAQLQDRGLKIKAIRDLLGRVEKGETQLDAWLGIEDRLREPWANDESRIVDEKELSTLAGELRPGRLADLVRHGLVARRGAAFLVPSLALLQLALRLESTGVDLDAVAGLPSPSSPGGRGGSRPAAPLPSPTPCASSAPSPWRRSGSSSPRRWSGCCASGWNQGRQPG
jgi:DNA-binding transcriptional MerR regulator